MRLRLGSEVNNMIYTTLNEIRRFYPSKSAWSRLLSYLGKTAADDEPLPLVTVLDSNGLRDTIWCLRVCPDIAAKFARWCADRTAEAAYWADRATYGATRADDAAEAAYWVTNADEATDWAAEAAYWAADWASWASWAAEAAGWAAGATETTAGATETTAGATERQAQADKLRELLS